MNKRTRHTGKSSRQTESYLKQLTLLGYESTVEEQPIFSVSDGLPISPDFEKQPTPQRSRKRRPQQPSASSISRYLRKNWIPLCIPIFAVLLGIVVYDHSKDIGYLQGVMSQIENTITSLATQLQNIQDKTHEQDMEIQKQNIELKHMGDDLQDLKKGASSKN